MLKKTQAVLSCLCMILMFLQGCSGSSGNSDLKFAKKALESLFRADTVAEEMIDWERFRVNDMNVGVQYLAMPDDKEKANFRNAFVTQFSSSSQRLHEGGKVSNLDSLTNWRVQDENSASTIIAADTPNGSIFITVSKRNGKQSVSAFDFESGSSDSE